MAATAKSLHDFFPKPWVFLRNELGYVTLAIVAPGGMLPMFIFESDESFRDFVMSADRAYEEFIPLPLREALEVVDAERFGEQDITS